MLPRPDQPPLGVGESASVPSAAAIANAIFDATGVRFREPPFTPERILAGLRGEGYVKRRCAAAGVTAAAEGSGRMAGSVRQAARRAGRRRRPVRRCGRHRAPRCCRGGRSRRSRRRMRRSTRPRRSPAGRSSPRWATARSATPIAERRRQRRRPRPRDAVRHGLQHQHHARSRDRHRRMVLSRLRARDARGHSPRWPASLSGLSLSAFRQDDRCRPAGALRLSDGAAAGARRRSPRPTWHFRSTCVRCWPAWNALFHRAGPFEADPTKSAAWNRGAYLVEGLGHCGACHSPRNALGAERGGAYLAGGFADGWEAPPLTSLSHAPIPWSEDELLRLPAHRRIPLPRRRRRSDGAGGEGACGPARRGHPRHGGLSRFVPGPRHRCAGAGRLAAQLETPTRTPIASGVGGAPVCRAPARFATRSAAPRCSAAGRRSRSTAICTAPCPTI